MELKITSQPFPMKCPKDPAHVIARIEMRMHTATDDHDGTVREIHGIGGLAVVCESCGFEREAIAPVAADEVAE